MRLNFPLAIAGALLLASCAAPVKHYTASKRPEVTIAAPAADVKPVMVNDLVNMGYYPVQDTPMLLVMDRPVDNTAANLLMGSVYNPVAHARLAFTLTEKDGSTRVVANMAIVTNPGSAYEKLAPMNNSVDSRNLQAWLNGLKARF